MSGEEDCNILCELVCDLIFVYFGHLKCLWNFLWRTRRNGFTSETGV